MAKATKSCVRGSTARRTNKLDSDVRANSSSMNHKANHELEEEDVDGRRGSSVSARCTCATAQWSLCARARPPRRAAWARPLTLTASATSTRTTLGLTEKEHMESQEREELDPKWLEPKWLRTMCQGCFMNYLGMNQVCFIGVYKFPKK